MRTRSSIAIFIMTLVFGAAITLHADSAAEPPMPADDLSNSANDTMEAESAAPAATPEEVAPTPKPTPRSSRRIEKADAFIAPADWEFDGFVAGGQDQEIRSLYYLNDLVYLNVGTDQGFRTGDRVSIFKRGQRVRDPQTGKFLGYEVRRAAATQVTNKMTGNTCSVRILQANEAVEVGDLVRRDD